MNSQSLFNYLSRATIFNCPGAHLIKHNVTQISAFKGNNVSFSSHMN